ARPEGFGFILLAAVALLMHRRWWWIVILPIPLLVWDYVGWRVYGGPMYREAQHLPAALAWLPWLKHVWPYAPESLYGRGSILQYVWFLPAVVSPLILPATLLGIWRCLSGREGEAPAELGVARQSRLGGSLALPAVASAFVRDHR